MISQSVRLGKIFGIPIGVNYSWFIVFALVTLSLSAQFSIVYSEWSSVTHYMTGLLTSVLFFLSVLLHELGHSVAAMSKGIGVRAITLFIFGGVAQISREPDKPFTEFFIAVMGPVVSVLLAGGFFLLSILFHNVNEPLYALSIWLARINFILVLFNMIPGFPLDGGRVLRAIVWYLTDSYERSTRIASGVGQGFAYLFILIGIWFVVSGNWFNGLWIAFIGWFLLTAAQQVSQYVTLRTALRGITADDIMDADCPKINERMSVHSLIEDHFLRSGRRCYLVSEGDSLIGLVTLHQLKQVPRRDWEHTVIRDIMTPSDQLHSVEPETSVSDILDLITAEDISQVPVVKDGKLYGLIGRDRILKVVRARLELGV